MLKRKEVISYYEDGTKITEVTTQEGHETIIEKDGEKSMMEVTDSGIKFETGSIEERIEKVETECVKVSHNEDSEHSMIDSNEFVRKWGNTKLTFDDETIKEIIKGINRVSKNEGSRLIEI